MTDRDHGDDRDEVERGSGETVALAGRTRRRTRKRSLRVPVDEVPRRPSNPDGELITELADSEVEGLPPLTSEPTQVSHEDVTSSVEVGVEIAELDLPEEELAAEELDDESAIDESSIDESAIDESAIDESDALASEPTRLAPPRRRRDTIVSDEIPVEAAAGAREAIAPAEQALEPATAASAQLESPPQAASPPEGAAASHLAGALEDAAPAPTAPALAAPADVAAPESAPAGEPDVFASDAGARAPDQDAHDEESEPFELRRSDPGAEDVADRTAPGSQPSPERPAVVVTRMLTISSPPPAPDFMRAPEPSLEDEPELSISESFDDLEVDVGDDERDEGDAGIDDELSAAEIELPDEDELNADEVKPPPPPVRAKAEAEEELAPDDLEVEASGETPVPAAEEPVRKQRSAPPPPPEKPARAAPPPPAAAAPASAPAATSSAVAAAPLAGSTPEQAAEAPRRTRKKGEWWEGFFNDDYLRTVPPPNPRQIARQCDFIESRLALKEGSTILDVGCGLGLHAVELTRRGYLVVGLDLSLPMLSRAADEAQDQGFRINFLHADMREMNFEGAFDAVLCWGTTFGYFDDDQNRAIVERLHRALRPKGKLLLEVVNRDFVVPNQPNLVWFEGDGCVVMEETQVNFISSRLTVKRTVILDDGRQRDNAYSVRLYALHELGQILHQRGFRVIEVTGREATPGVFFGADSPKLIILAERRIQQNAPPTPPKKPSTETGEGASAATTPGDVPSAEPEGGES